MVQRVNPEIEPSGLFPDEITRDLALSPLFRGDQIFHAIHAQGCEHYSEISSLPADLRCHLGKYSSLRCTREYRVFSLPDSTKKVRVKLKDGYVVEAVLLCNQSGRFTACLSSQAGCVRGCLFCRTGEMGLKRNLTCAEITEQFLILRKFEREINNVVFMGMGEPLDNLAQTKKAAAILCHSKGAALSPRRITVSTCGVIKGIKSLAEKDPRVRLALSVGSAIPEKRAELMPVTKSNPLPELKTALKVYQAVIKKRITLEYVLIKGINDTNQDIKALSDFAKGLSTVVNIIGWNSIPKSRFKSPSKKDLSVFENTLKACGLKTTVRASKGQGIGAACGQLSELE